MKASDLFVRCLENEGIEYIFGVPGEENADFKMSLEQSERITFVLCRHEQGAAFMAEVYGRLTGNPAGCLGTLGPGAANLITGVRAGSPPSLSAMPQFIPHPGRGLLGERHVIVQGEAGLPVREDDPDGAADAEAQATPDAALQKNAIRHEPTRWCVMRFSTCGSWPGPLRIAPCPS